MSEFSLKKSRMAWPTSSNFKIIYAKFRYKYIFHSILYTEGHFNLRHQWGIGWDCGIGSWDWVAQTNLLIYYGTMGLNLDL